MISSASESNNNALKYDPLNTSTDSYYTQQEILNVSTNINYRKSSNSVKLLPVIDNNNGKVKLYTEVNSNFKVGDNVFIMYDDSQTYSRIYLKGDQNSSNKIFQFFYAIPYGATYYLYKKTELESDYSLITGYTINIERNSITIDIPPASTDSILLYYNFIPDLILDNYIEFSGCTSLTTNLFIANWQYLYQTQGYKVLEINELNNEITIDRYFDSRFLNKKIYDHYIGRTYIKNMDFVKGEIDGALIKNLILNSGETSYIDINMIQSIVFSGMSNMIDIKDKYDDLYVSTNTEITEKTTATYKPYVYKGSNIIDNQSDTISSYYSKNNNYYGYNYVNNTQITGSTIRVGYFKNCVIKDCYIYGGEFTNCAIIGGSVSYGYFINCQLDSSRWLNGIWEDQTNSEDTFNPYNGVWSNGIWNYGIFRNMTWLDGVFNDGYFYDSVWTKGTFKGGNMLSTDDSNIMTWYDGIFSGGYMTNMIWINGSFNGGTMTNCSWSDGVFNDGVMTASKWGNGIFNGGQINQSLWYNGTFNNGLMTNCYWENGIFNGGIFESGNDVKFGNDTSGLFTTGGVYSQNLMNKNYYWYNGTFNGGSFLNSIWTNGLFNNGLIDENSLWVDGNFLNGEFKNSYWMHGTFKQGKVTNSSFHSVDWGRGTWISGNLGIIDNAGLSPTTYPIVNWRGGVFNEGIFGHVLWNYAESYVGTNNSTGITYNPYLGNTNLSAVTMNWYDGNFYGKHFCNYFASGDTVCSIVVGGFSGGTFYNGYFRGVFFNGTWAGGTFLSPPCCNKSRQIVGTTTFTTTPKLNKKLGRKYGEINPLKVNKRYGNSVY